MDWETLSCGLRGHVTFRPDESDLRARLHVGTPAGESWRCLRCGVFVPGEPSRHGPSADAPEVPRGRLLRDLIIMRLLAVERLLRGIVLFLGAYVVFRYAGSRDSLRAVFDRELPLLRPIADQFGWNIDDSKIVQWAERSFSLSTSTVVWIGVAVALYGLGLCVEAVGLWLIKRWGEYFSVVVTSVFLPLEIYELTEKVTVLKVAILLVNIAAVLWLVWSKRLFGVRGGAAAYHAEHEATSLLTVERAAVSEAVRPD